MLPLQQAIEVRESVLNYLHATYRFKEEKVGDAFFRFLRALVAEGPNDLFLTGAPLQRIYTGRKLNFSACGINVRGRSRRLRVNNRTTEEIRRVATSVVKGIE